LNTEANPLNYPPTSSADEQNLEIERDGGRSRRPGFDVEQFYQENTAPITIQTGVEIGRNQFHWKNVGGDPDVEFVVVQLGNYVAIHNLGEIPVSATPVFTKTFATSVYGNTFGFSDVDGSLVIATGLKQVTVLTYDGTTITSQDRTLYTRDLFGVASTISGDNLTDALGLQIRPTTKSDEHIYNLRNQTWGPPRVEDGNTTTQKDCITEFEATASAYPSNADYVTPFLFADVNKTSDENVKRFFHTTAVSTPPRSARAPLGYFIIDALERGVSRLSEVQKLNTTYSVLGHDITSLPADTTPGGPSVVGQYAGRVWYGGFSGEVVDGDAKSPRMSSYLLFSRLVRDPSEINLCYQAADPTDAEDPDLVSTDGGFIKIDGAYNIQALVAIETSLFVMAENGVWQITGDDSNTFTATAYSVSKISSNGCVSGNSVVLSNNRLAYWGENAIYGVERDQFGSWVVINTTEDTIQTLYDSIPLTDKENSIGYYDEDNNTIRWVYGGSIGSRETTTELLLDLRFSAYTKNLINLPGDVQGILSVSGGESNLDDTDLSVTVGGVAVTVGGETVFVPQVVLSQDVTQSYYTVLLEFDNAVKYTFGRYRRADTPYDWTALGLPTDSPAFLQTGPVTLGDARLRKDVPYLTSYLRHAPTDEVVPSCFLKTKWDWTIDIETEKWSTPRQVYRPMRPEQAGGITSSRSRVRGGGRSVAFRFESEEGKPFRIYGWELNVQSGTEE
jgi:hypothetical protein